MKLIKLTNHKDSKPIYINIETIGYVYQQVDRNYSLTETYTVVGTTTHNNGGFKIAESVEQVLKLIEKAK